MKRINVIGSSGSGKSTFAKALAQKLDVTHIEMDKLFWKAGWRESTDHEFFSNLKTALTQSEWVLEGNYFRTESIKWQDVDTIIWLDYSRTVTFYRAIKRALTRIYTEQERGKGLVTEKVCIDCSQKTPSYYGLLKTTQNDDENIFN